MLTEGLKFGGENIGVLRCMHKANKQASTIIKDYSDSRHLASIL